MMRPGPPIVHHLPTAQAICGPGPTSPPWGVTHHPLSSMPEKARAWRAIRAELVTELEEVA